MVRAFKGCVECQGRSGRPRNGVGGKTCSANQCKKNYKRRRADDGSSAAATVELGDMAPALGEVMPEGTWVHELDEILGERCCELRLLNHKKRKCGPGTLYQQQYLVRGKFLEEDGDEDEDEDDSPEPNTYWVNEVDLLDTIAKSDVKAALVARHNHVMRNL